MKRFYRYLIYKLYSWGLKKQGDTPIANVILTISFVHLVNLFILLMILDRFFLNIDFLFGIPKGILILCLISFPVLNYFLIYNKNRWQEYIEEFKNESPKESKQGKLLVLAYLIGSIVVFFILLPVLFGV
jgi:uncharacterized membrane protein